MSRLRLDIVGRLAWLCRSCTHGFWASLASAGFGCHDCGSTDVATLLDGAIAAGPTDRRLDQAVADSQGGSR